MPSERESETLLTGRGAASAPDSDPESPPESPPARARSRLPLGWLRGVARSPLVPLLLYYALLISLDAFLIDTVPAVRQAFVAPSVLESISQANTLTSSPNVLMPERVVGIGSTGAPALQMAVDRALTTLLVIVGALSLVLPVAWVYMRTKRFRYDPALVRSVIILPIVVAGIAMVVKSSLALAFSLAGIVAAVRFRNTLKDPRDAVYIFLVIGIGLSAGVQAVDVALVMSFAFNLVVLLLWQYNVGSVYSGSFARTGVLSVGDPSLFVAQTPDAQRTIRRRLFAPAKAIKADGILLVHAPDAEVARYTIQDALGDVARDWRLTGIEEGKREASTLEYVVKLKKKSSPPKVIAALDERWSAQVDAAEFIPFRKRKRKRDTNEESVIQEGAAGARDADAG
ncbi:MAG: DUF4956 domain-containing protein [Gemmatimonadota bacterium]|nr:DUF4956 domain-containing protein [Gemmatimonadota bacterium]